ncbi:hypothetical protein EJ08DRAFT_477371 [Tothia fuscella]|uniref:Uncharacterized protein n=1 Tax=Tothia fuscella TaxID=1048955 RepID=A0A9P4TUQ1_9PEZI|nr:hypothetical protein EJ08DRAFT_477371 [Tothia fuscella]
MARSHYGFLWLALLVSCLTFRPLIERYASFIGPDVLLDFTSSSGQLNHIRDQFGHVAPSKLAVPFGDHLTINATRALFKRLRSSVEISDQEWNDLLNKASDLRCMMKLSAELTATLGHAAKMTDHKAEFERRGWRTTRTTHAVIGEGWWVSMSFLHKIVDHAFI